MIMTFLCGVFINIHFFFSCFKGNAEKSRDAVVFCINYRKDPLNKFYFDKIQRGEDLALTQDLEKLGLRGFAMHLKGGLDGGPIQLVRQGIILMNGVLCS